MLQSQLPVVVETKIPDRAFSCILVHGGGFAVETICAKPVISGNSRKSRPLFTCQRTPSTSNGRAARQGYQWRNYFCENDCSDRKTRKIFFRGGCFVFAARCANG